VHRPEPAAEFELATIGIPRREISRPAPAKINLALHVTGRRRDGYHLLESLVVFTRLSDRISVAPAPVDRIGLEGRFSGQLANDSDNLVARARDAMRQRFRDRDTPPVFIALDKNLPVASGIGGGSSDAAATLVALAAHWNIEPDPTLLATTATELGADVPMCLFARPLVARGIGDRIEPLTGFPGLKMVLANPGSAVATADIFTRLQKRDSPPLPDFKGVSDLDALFGLLSTVRNDLQAPAIEAEPAILTVLSALNESGAVVTRMSGSGATCFGLYESDAAAEDAADAVAAKYPDWFVAVTQSTGDET
jgi:4-diphosphocytidyl-2-C-methyl-D-erythritol kinase